MKLCYETMLFPGDRAPHHQRAPPQGQRRHAAVYRRPPLQHGAAQAIHQVRKADESHHRLRWKEGDADIAIAIAIAIVVAIVVAIAVAAILAIAIAIATIVDIAIATIVMSIT
jgi:hypothetical protein